MQRAQAMDGIQKLYVKIRFADFHHTTVERGSKQLDFALFAELIETGFMRSQQPVRLLGLGVRLAEERAEQRALASHRQQLSLFQQEE